MFQVTYPCTFLQYRYVKDGVHFRTHIYTFTAKNNIRYIIEFDEFIGGMLLVKFYQKRHSKSINKYHLMTGSGWACSVIYTVFTKMLDILRSNKIENVSFAFMGSNTLFDDGSEEGRANTKRFLFYKKLVAMFIGNQTFKFKQNTDSSIFVLINKQNKSIDNNLSSILKYIYTNYSVLEVDLILEPLNLLDAQSG